MAELIRARLVKGFRRAPRKSATNDSCTSLYDRSGTLPHGKRMCWVRGVDCVLVTSKQRSDQGFSTDVILLAFYSVFGAIFRLIEASRRRTRS